MQNIEKIEKTEFFPERDDEIYYQIAEGVRLVGSAFLIVIAAAIFFAPIFFTPEEIIAFRLMVLGF